jgi:hypothetical protein
MPDLSPVPFRAARVPQRHTSGRSGVTGHRTAEWWRSVAPSKPVVKAISPTPSGTIQLISVERRSRGESDRARRCGRLIGPHRERISTRRAAPRRRRTAPAGLADPRRRLLRPLLSFAHRHRRVVRGPDRVDPYFGVSRGIFAVARIVDQQDSGNEHEHTTSRRR